MAADALVGAAESVEAACAARTAVYAARTAVYAARAAEDPAPRGWRPLKTRRSWRISTWGWAVMPEKLVAQMVATARADNDLFTTDEQRIVVMAWAEMVLAIAEERDEAVAQAQAAAQEAATLREAASALIAAADEILREHGQEAHIWRLSVHAAKLDAALATPPTAYAKLAAAYRQVSEAAEVVRYECSAPDMQGVYIDQPQLRSTRIRLDALWVALDALAEAEREAGVSGP